MSFHDALFCFSCPGTPDDPIILEVPQALPVIQHERILDEDVAPSLSSKHGPYSSTCVDDSSRRVGRNLSESTAATRIQASYRGHSLRRFHGSGLIIRASLAEGFVDLPPREAGPYLSCSPVKACTLAAQVVGGSTNRSSCASGHPLLKSWVVKSGACALCGQRLEAGSSARECCECRCYFCATCPWDSVELEPGQHVRLRNMRFAALDCTEGIILQRVDSNRYTVRLSTLDDRVTLPLENLCRVEDGREPDANSEVDMRKSNQRAKTPNDISSFAALRSTLRHHTFRLERTLSVAGPLLEAWWAEKKLLAKEQLLHVSEPLRRGLLDSISETLRRSSTRDPDLWRWLRPAAQSAVVGLWKDIEAEIELSLEAAIHRQKTVAQESAARSPTEEQRLGLLQQVRASILYHYLPSDKTIFGKMRDPVYLSLVAFTMLPVFGVRFLFFGVLLLLLIFPGPPDEWQLVSFILHFKGVQFFTSGVSMAFIGAMRQHSCVLSCREDIRRCFDTKGPGASSWLWNILMDYCGSVVLVWAAFLVLPRSRKHPEVAALRRTISMQKTGRYCFCLQGIVTQGGRLWRLLYYDVVAFALSVVLFAPQYLLLALQQSGEPQRPHMGQAKALVYWANCLYSLLSLPFVFFVLPVFSRLLTHSVITGYDRHGDLVRFDYPESQVCRAAPSQCEV